MLEFRYDPDGSLWSYEEGVRIARVVTVEDILEGGDSPKYSEAEIRQLIEDAKKKDDA